MMRKIHFHWSSKFFISTVSGLSDGQNQLNLFGSLFSLNQIGCYSELLVITAYRSGSLKLLTFTYTNHLLPSMFLNLFETSHQVHNYSTRIANSYRPHFCCTSIKQFTILYQCPKIWNSLPGSIVNSSSYMNFKKNMLGFHLKKKLS